MKNLEELYLPKKKVRFTEDLTQEKGKKVVAIKIKRHSYFQSQLQKLYEEQNCNHFDVKFILEPSMEEVYASKYTLSAMSEVFKKMFFGKMGIKGSMAVKVKCKDHESFRAMIYFCMTGELKIKVEHSLTLAFLADEYLVTTLKEELSKKIVSCINSENVLDLYLAATTLVSETIKKHVRKLSLSILWILLKIRKY